MFGWLRPKPPSDLAQAVIDLMADPTRWTVEPKAVRHAETDLVVRYDWDLSARNEWPVAVVMGEHAYPFREDRDFGPLTHAFKRLRRDAAKHAEEVAGQQIRAKLTLPALQTTFAAESVDVVEARVQRLRAAMLSAPPRSRPSPDPAA